MIHKLLNVDAVQLTQFKMPLNNYVFVVLEGFIGFSSIVGVFAFITFCSLYLSSSD